MKFQLSKHLEQEAAQRGIPWAVVEAVLAAPEQTVSELGTVVCYQSRMTINAKPYLVRVMVEQGKEPPVAVSVYRTSKIEKYWKQT
jgi:hypothetical protein